MPKAAQLPDGTYLLQGDAPETSYNERFSPMIESRLSELESSALARIEAARTPDELESVRVDVLGRKGSLALLSKEMGKIPPDQRAAFGKRLNAVKQSADDAFERKQKEFAESALRVRLDAEWVDLTLPAPGPEPGSLHPISQIQHEIEDLFISLGFAVLDGPEVETEWHNFDALNIPRPGTGTFCARTHLRCRCVAWKGSSRRCA
jgi:phenylalanyl-tRNA synthetase alpha chain